MKSQLFVQTDSGEFCKCRLYSLFIYRNNLYKLAQIVILQDGRMECEGAFWSYSDLCDAVEQGIIRTRIPDKERLSIPDLIGFWVHDVLPIVEEKEFLKEIQDIVNELNDRPTTSDQCRDAHREFQKSPTEQNRRKLKVAYEAVPKHLDCWLLSFDEKDVPIRRAIYGDDF